MHQMIVNWTVVGQRSRNPLELRAGYAGDTLGFRRVPLIHFLPNPVQAPNALADELLVFPAILEDMPENAPDERHVGARTEPHVLVGVGRGTREARVADDQRRVILFLRPEHVLHRDRMCFGRVATDLEDGARLWMSLYEFVIAP